MIHALVFLSAKVDRESPSRIWAFLEAVAMACEVLTTLMIWFCVFVFWPIFIHTEVDEEDNGFASKCICVVLQILWRIG
jgi:hypothetical protein